MGLRPYPPDGGLKEPVRKFEDTFSVWTVIKEAWFPHLLTEREKVQIARRDRWPEATEAQVTAIDKLVAPEFETGDWQTVESEKQVIEK